MAEYLNIKKNEDIDVNVPLKFCVDTLSQQIESNTSQILTNTTEIANNTTNIDNLQHQVNNLGEAVPPTRKINGKALSQDISLRYDEFIAPIISVIQSQQKEIEELKTKINKLLKNK